MKQLRDLSHDTRIYAVFAAYGQAMLSAHALEKKLASIVITHIADSHVSSSNRSAEIERIDRMTLGNLINEFSLRHSPSDSLAEELDNMLFFRNELTHRISDTLVSATVELQWEEKIISELVEYTTMFKETSKLLSPYAEKWLTKHNFDMKSILETALNTYIGIKTDL